jgi:hypothetical protein
MNIVLIKRVNVCKFFLVFVIVSFVALTLKEFGCLAKISACPEKIQVNSEVIEAPEELIFALANVAGDVGSVDEQRSDIEKISEALRSQKTTSKALGKKGSYWLTELRRRVDVRQAVEAFEELQELEIKSCVTKLSRSELSQIPRLRKTVENQIYSQYAKEEGLNCNHAQIGNLVNQITMK